VLRASAQPDTRRIVWSRERVFQQSPGRLLWRAKCCAFHQSMTRNLTLPDDHRAATHKCSSTRIKMGEMAEELHSFLEVEYPRPKKKNAFKRAPHWGATLAKQHDEAQLTEQSESSDTTQKAERKDQVAGGGNYSLPRSQWANSPQLSSLWERIYLDDFDAVSRILSEEPQMVHARSADGRGPLFWAHEHRRPMIISLLERSGANPSAQDAKGKTPTDLKSEAMLLIH